MEDAADRIAQECFLSNLRTQGEIEGLEKDLKDMLRAVISGQWDPENQEIIDQFTGLANKNDYLQTQLVQKDVEIYKLREILADKRKLLKQSKIGLDSLKSLIKKTEESLFQRDMMILEQSEKLSGQLETQPGHSSIKRLPAKALETCKSQKLIPVNSSYQGASSTKPATKAEDKGKQELSMPFLSSSSQNWVSSLRTPNKSPKRLQNK